MQYREKYQSPAGDITMASDGENLTGLWFDGQKYFPDEPAGKIEYKMLEVFQKTSEWLDIYFRGSEPDFTPPLYLEGTPFRLSVWELLRQIPYGSVTTYQEIARKMAVREGMTRMSAQAVGGAVAHNRISIIIPCHRVVGANGSLTGYAGGIEKKIKLLTLEKADMKRLFVPKSGTAL